MTRYIFVCGGVMSGVGKGVSTASLGLLLKNCGYSVEIIKADPYLNVDAGTMNPTEHGEVFVMDDGLETDQDIGNYERFLNKSLKGGNYMTSGMVFRSVIERERALGYGGKCVEYFYHVPLEIIDRIKQVGGDDVDFVLIEVGGTVGEYHNALYLEAARRMIVEGGDDVAVIMVSYLPVPSSIGEMKTKPTQIAIGQLRSFGLSPDFIICRSELSVDDKRKKKIALYAGMPQENVISAPDVESVYDVPANFAKEGLHKLVLKFFGLDGELDMEAWNRFVESSRSCEKSVKIAVLGKYFDTGDFVLSDAYISVIEALKVAGYSLGVMPELHWINSKDYESGKRDVAELVDFGGVVVPGGFGSSGVEGKIEAIKFVRENGIPFLGLCYGMQLMVVEYARNVCGMDGANTTEIDAGTEYPVVDILPSQKEKLERGDYGGSMRLGLYDTCLADGTIARRIYGKDKISERHRHRYEVNPEFVERLEKGGMVFSGRSCDGDLVEIAELLEGVHKFMVGVQFHPEFLSRPLSPHPLFVEFVKRAAEE